MCRIKLYVIAVIVFFSVNHKSIAACVGLGCTCVVAATPVLFAVYDPDLATPTNSTGTITVTCTALIVGAVVSYNIRLSKGNSSTYSPRYLTNGSFNLNYNLYTDAGRTLIWGDTTGGTSEVSDGYTSIILNTIKLYTVYGQIPIHQVIGSGLYSDSIVATVIF